MIRTRFVLAVGSISSADEVAQRGCDKLTNHAFLPPDFNQATSDQIWTNWPEPLRTGSK